MPLYEYQCDACGHRFEAIRKFSDEPLEVCPQCGGHIQKLISAPAFTFKGTGWYITDYAKKDSVPGGKSEGGKDGSSEKESKDSKDSSSSKDTKESGGKDSKSSDTSTKESSSTPAKTETSTKSESSSTPDKSA